MRGAVFAVTPNLGRAKAHSYAMESDKESCGFESMVQQEQ